MSTLTLASSLRQRALDVAGHRTTGIEIGEGELCLVWFPALMDSARSFAPVALALASRFPEELRICAFDPPGYGDSAGCTTVPTFAELEPWIAELLSKLGSRFVLCGNSSGAVMAISGGSLAPQRVEGLVLVGWCDWRLIGTPHRDLLCPTNPTELRRLFERGWHRPPRLLRETWATQLRYALRDDYRAHVASFDPQRFGAQLDRYDVPLAIVAGESDGLIEPSMVRSLAEARPDACVYWLRECGHYPHREQPRQLAAALIDWLCEIDPLRRERLGAPLAQMEPCTDC